MTIKKTIFIFAVCFLFFKAVDAQKRDTSVYYLNNAGQVISNKDSADFFLLILPPDPSVNKNLFVVKEYYPDGKIRLVGGSRENTLDNLKFQGPYVAFFENGHRMMMRNYDNGVPSGDEIEYYPNGKLYNIRTYTTGGGVLLKQCNDSTGNVLAKNGTGKWIEYNDNFSLIKAEGEIANGLEDGDWHGMMSDSLSFESVFRAGELVTREWVPKHIPDGEIFTIVQQMPKFPGGIGAFYKFIAHYIRYPVSARVDGIQGKTITSFIVEKDGRLTDVKNIKDIGDGCGAEAARVVKLSPLWEPGMQNGKPVRVEYSVPIYFTLSDN